MGFSSQFDKFDAVDGFVPGWPFTSLPDIARRARQILKGRTREQIAAGASVADFFIEEWYLRAQEGEIKRLRDLVSNFERCALDADDPEYLDAQREYIDALRFFIQEPDAASDEPSRFNDAMEYELADRVKEHTSEVEALKDGVEGWTLDDATQREFPDGGEHEYLAIMALWLVADALRWIDNANNVSGTRDFNPDVAYSIAADYAIRAMAALCYAEGRLERRQFETMFKAWMKTAEDQAVERAVVTTKKAMASKAAIAKHHENRLLKADVIEYYEAHESEFSSIEAAAAAIAGKIVLLKHRTVVDHIAKYRKERSARKP